MNLWAWLVGGAAGVGALLAARAALAAKRTGGTTMATTNGPGGGAVPPPIPGGSAPAGRDPVSGVSISNGVATGPNGVTYTFTDEDKLWLGRAVKGESGTHAQGGAAVCWSMINNYLTTGPRGGPRFTALPTFTALLRAYCQPINPAWLDPNGAKCRRMPQACTPALIQRRREHMAMPWESLPGAVRQIVENFLAGNLASPVPGSTDWASTDWAPGVVNIGGNRFGRRVRS